MRQKAVENKTVQRQSWLIKCLLLPASHNSVEKEARVCMQHVNYMQKLVSNWFSL